MLVHNQSHTTPNIIPAPQLPSEDTGLVWAADVQSQKDAFEILDQIRDCVTMVKIGHILLWACGVEILSQIKATYRIPILADPKLCDVPHFVGIATSIL